MLEPTQRNKQTIAAITLLFEGLTPLDLDVLDNELGKAKKRAACPLNEEEIALLTRTRNQFHPEAYEGYDKIQAIKALRIRTGLGLKDSKDVVDHYCATHPRQN
jgi:hypothetical protein